MDLEEQTPEQNDLEPTTPKEGATAAIFSMYEELGQFSVILEMQFRILQSKLPADSPIQQQVNNLLTIQQEIESILQRYKDAANTGEFGFSELYGQTRTPALDIHPRSRAQFSEKNAPEGKV